MNGGKSVDGRKSCPFFAELDSLLNASHSDELSFELLNMEDRRGSVITLSNESTPVMREKYEPRRHSIATVHDLCNSVLTEDRPFLNEWQVDGGMGQGLGNNVTMRNVSVGMGNVGSGGDQHSNVGIGLGITTEPRPSRKRAREEDFNGFLAIWRHYEMQRATIEEELRQLDHEKWHQLHELFQNLVEHRGQ